MDDGAEEAGFVAEVVVDEGAGDAGVGGDLGGGGGFVAAFGEVPGGDGDDLGLACCGVESSAGRGRHGDQATTI